MNSKSKIFKSWCRNKNKYRKSDFPYFLSFEDYSTLNFLALTYHSAFGYDLDGHSLKEEVQVQELFPLSIEAEDDDMFYIKLDEAKKDACSYNIRHKTIKVRLNPQGTESWKEKPGKVTETWFRQKGHPHILPVGATKEGVYWYEFPEDVFTGKYTKMLLGPLSDRKYIHVIDLFEEIELRSVEKKKPITIDDVLFACRGLCCDDTRSIDRFSVLSDDGETLTLMAHIDNWST